MIKSIDSKQLKNKLESGQVILIDVREHNEFESEHIEGAINIPLSQFYKINDIELTDDKILVMQCRIGARSMSACQLLQELNFTNEVWNLEGGIEAWKDQKYKIISKLLSDIKS